MKTYVVLNPLGVFAVDNKGNIIEHIFFKQDAVSVAEKLLQDMTPEEKDVIARLSKKGFKVIISSRRNDAYVYEPNNLGDKVIRREFRKIKEKFGFDDFKLNQFLTGLGIEFSRKRIKETVKKDRIIMEVIDAIDEIDKSLNIFSARLREWYGLHFPEVNRLIDKHEKFAKLVSNSGLRKNITEKEFVELAKKSMGIELNESDEKFLKDYASQVVSLFKLREDMEKYLTQVMKEVAPNFTELAGSLLGARLIALAGGIDKLAKRTSSTIQLFGAEKALFRYLHKRGRSPKHGILFLHPLIQKAPVQKRGKIARVLAAKLSIAIKMDYYGEHVKSDMLVKDLEERMKKIMEE